MISQKLNTVVRTLRLIYASRLTVIFPKYSPATATATNPDTPREFASTTEPNTVAMVKAVSEKGSFINECNLFVAIAIPKPTAAPPKNTMAKCSDSPIRFEIPSPLPLLLLTPITTARIDENIIKPVASLKLASNSINVERPLGTLNFLNISITIAGSVGEISAAKRNETAKLRPATYISRKPATNVDTTTPAVANSRAEILDRKSTRLNSSHMSISYAVFCLKKK